MEFFERLRQERERLGMSQVEFGAVGGVKKLAQINYEKGERNPDSAYLSAIAAAGADVLFILTGQYVGSAKPEAALSHDESELLTMYREAPFAAKAAARGALEGALAALKSESAAPAVRIGRMTNKAPGGVQIGHAGGNVTVKGR